MSAELWYPFWGSLLLTMMWIPHIIGQVTNAGLLTRDDYLKLRDPVFVAGFSRFMARTVVFTVAWATLLVLAWQIVANAVSGG